MKDVPQNELLSAYLDGELTAEEQAEVEQLLAASPAARQLVDELRALSSSLQALPSHQIGEDLSQQVLRLAEQAQRDPGAAPEKPKATAEQPERPWRAMIRRFARPRNLVWAGAAVAAALLLLVIQSAQLSRPGDGEIAMDTGAEDAPAAASPAAEALEAGEMADAEIEAASLSEADAAPPASRGAPGGFVVGKAGPRDAAPGLAPAAPAPAAPLAEAFSKPAMPEPTEEPAPAGPDADPFGGAGMGRRVAKEGRELEVQPPGREMPRKDQPEYAMKKEEDRDEAIREETAVGFKPDQPPSTGQPPAPALVVSCWGTPAAFEKLAFERLLEETGVRRLKGAGLEAEDVRLRAAASQAPRVESYATEAKASALPQVVDVQVTREQLRGLMRNMQGRPDLSSFAYLAPGQVRLALDGHRARADLQRARTSQAAGDAQRDIGRMEVDKLLDSIKRAEAQYIAPREAEIGVRTEGESPLADSALQMKRALTDVEPQARLRQQAGQPKAGPATAFGAGGAGPAPPGAARESGLAGKAAPAMPVPSRVLAPTEPAPDEAQAEMPFPAEQRPADEEEREADEPPERPAGRPRRPTPAPEKSEKRVAEAMKSKQPAPIAPGEPLDQYAGTYYVRFEFHLVDRPDVAASRAAMAADAMMAEEPPMAMEAAEEPPAAAAPVVQEQP